jgi:drug/metabolite transporter (DMT)-like permease
MRWDLTLLALGCYSLLGLTLKSAAMKKNDPGRLIWFALVVVSVISLGLTLFTRVTWSWQAVVLGLVSGGFFYLASVERVKALQTSPAGVVFAITNLDLVINSMVVAFLPFLNGAVTVQKITAAVLAGIAIFLVSWARGQKGKISWHTYLSLGLLVISGLGYTTYASFGFPVILFIFVDHFAGVILNAPSARNLNRSEIIWGSAAGLLMFVGLNSLMNALQASVATISLTLIIVGLNTVVIALLGWLLFKEQLTRQQVLAVILAVIASAVVVLG